MALMPFGHHSLSLAQALRAPTLAATHPAHTRARRLVPRRGRGPGPSGGQRPPHPAPTLPRLRRYASGMWAAASLAPLPFGSGVCGRFFATSRPAGPGPLPLPSAGRAAAPGPAVRLRSGCWRPRRFRSSPSPGRSLSPRLLRSGRVRRCAAPWPLAAAPALWLPLGALRAPCSVALASLVGAFALRVGLPGPPLVAPCGASGPGPPRPGAAGALRPLSFPPRALFVLGCCAPCAFPPVGGVLPCAPPPRRPRWGLRGARGLRPWGLRPPLLRSSPPGWVRQAVRFPIVAAAGKGLAGQLAALALAAALFWAQGLDRGEHLRYYVSARPVPVLRHPPARVSVGRRKNSGEQSPGFFFCPFFPQLFTWQP